MVPAYSVLPPRPLPYMESDRRGAILPPGNHEHHQVGGRAVHGACCHACLFAPETSCEKGNRFLDRSTLVGTFSAKATEFFTGI